MAVVFFIRSRALFHSTAVIVMLAVVTLACTSSSVSTPGIETETPITAVATATMSEPTAPAAAPTAAGLMPVALVSDAGQGGELVLSHPWLPRGLYPYDDVDAALPSSLVLEPLARYRPDGELFPVLAAAMPSATGGIGEDGRTITWSLRDDVTWADGTPFTANDVVSTWTYCVETIECAVNVFDHVQSVTASGKHQVTITMDDTGRDIFAPFVGYRSPVLQADQLGRCGSDGCSDVDELPVGTGPFTFAEIKREREITYTMNTAYRGATQGQPFFGGVRMVRGADPLERLGSVIDQTGTDFAWNLYRDASDFGDLAYANTIRTANAGSTVYLAFNQLDNRSVESERAPYRDGTSPNRFFAGNPLLARAMSLAVDRAELSKLTVGMHGEATCSMWNIVARDTNDDACLLPDVKEANRILDEDLGYLDLNGDGVRQLPDGTPLEFDLLYVTASGSLKSERLIHLKRSWANIGIVVNPRIEDPWSQVWGDAGDPDEWRRRFPSDIQLLHLAPRSTDIATFYAQWMTNEIPGPDDGWGGSNIPRFSSDEYDRLATEALSGSATSQRQTDLQRRLDDILTESGALVPLFTREQVSAVEASLDGVGELNGWDSVYWNIHEWMRSE